MRILELFGGTMSFSKVCMERGHETFTVDIDKKFNPDLCIDVMDLAVDMVPFKPDVIWASPPCQKFSVMTISKNWIQSDGHYLPKTEETKKAIEIDKRMLELIKVLNPKLFFIENPRAMLRKMDFMEDIPRKTVTYCQYGTPYQKSTDIWTNSKLWNPRPVCSPKSPCHVRAPRGSRYGIQGMKFQQFPNRNGQNPLHPGDIASHHAYMHPEQMSDDKNPKTYGKTREFLHPHDLWATMEFNWDFSAKIRRGIVPRELCEEIIIACEKEVA